LYIHAILKKSEDAMGGGFDPPPSTPFMGTPVASIYTRRYLWHGMVFLFTDQET